MTARHFWLALLVIAVAAGGCARFGLPAALHAAGLHPDHERGDFDLAGRRALVIATNQAVLGETGDATGVFLSEVTEPYYDFLDAGMQVDSRARGAGG
jgi:hypothetical protein